MILLILKLIAVAWFITQVQNFIDGFNEFLKKPKKILGQLLSALNCIKCTSFWLTLIYTQDFILACQISLLAFLLDKFLLSTPVKL